MDNQNEPLDPQVVNLAKSIRQIESGNNFNAKGKSGEYGAYQYTPGTWQNDASRYGVNVPLENATPEQQNEVAYKKILDLKNQGLNVGQIASVWNSGKPQWEGNVGTNKYGVHYDTPDYVNKVADTYQKFKNGNQSPNIPTTSSTVNNGQTNESKNQPKKEGFLTSLFRGITSPVATMLARPAQLIQELLGASPEDVNKTFSQIPFYGDNGALNLPTSGNDVMKDVGRAAQTVALGLPVGKIGQAIGMGALSGAGSSLEKTGNVSDIPTGTALGSLSGLAGGLASKALEWLPKSIMQSSFSGLSPEEMQKALTEKSLGTKQSLLNQSKQSLGQYGKQIDDILKNTTNKGAGDFSIRATLNQFPEYNTEKGIPSMINKIKKLVPSSSKDVSLVTGKDRGTVLSYIDKIFNGNATLYEKNVVRSALDSSTSGGYAKMAKALNPSAGHDLGMTFADALRSEVKQSEPLTEPIFSEFSKEVNIKKALDKLNKKSNHSLIGWKDLVPFVAGNTAGGPLAGAGTVLANRALESPALQFGLAKTSQAIGNSTSPILNRAGILPGLINK